MSEGWRRRASRKKIKFKQSKINAALKKKLYGEIAFMPCYYCYQVFLKEQLTIEHLIPLSEGGSNEPDNIALACRPCNLQRGKETFMAKKLLNRAKFAVQNANSF
jgi:5-methylcytosine-specific restriction endonuclease McrA